jgi:hypothetical protein
MKFQDTPPTSCRKPNRFNKALGKHLGKWTLYKTYNSPNSAHTTAWAIRKNRPSWTKPDWTYEARTIRTMTQRYEVWVRAVDAPEQ